MGADGNEAPGTRQGISRRRVLASAGLAAAAVPLTAKGASAASLLKTAGAAGAPSPDGLHVQFGADASKQAAVSWLSPVQVRPARGGHHHRAGPVVGLPGPADPVRLRLVRRRAARAGRHQLDHRHPLRRAAQLARLRPARHLHDAQVHPPRPHLAPRRWSPVAAAK